MASINISENDFMIVAVAANLAKENSDHGTAEALDKLARKMNAALSNARAAKNPFGRVTKGMTWRDTPSTLD